MPRRALSMLVAMLMLAALLWPGATLATATAATSAAAAPAEALVPAAPPSGTEGLGASWYTVATPEGRTLLLAIYDTRPAPDQAVPAILVLHGTHGFARQYVEIAHDLSEQTGYVTAAGCWFDGTGPDAETGDFAPIRCPGGPEFAGATPNAWSAVRTLTQTVRQYAGNTTQLGIFGHARGGEVALQLASSPDPAGSGIQAVVSSSGTYTAVPRTPDYDAPTPLSLAESLSAPVLILHGQADTQARFSNAALYYERLQSLGKPAQCVVYPKMGHDAILHTTPGDAQHRVFTDGVRRSAAFFTGLFSELSAQQILDCSPA
jgi:dienelactone hydrolase